VNPTEPRFAFNEIAALYHRARPDYPEAVFGDICAAARVMPGDPMLDVGCGSGQATMGFVRSGLVVTALDPGGALLALARRRLDGVGPVAFVQNTFEAAPFSPGSFKLIASAQAWHWIAPDVGYARAASLLAPGGALAVFGNVPSGVTPPFDRKLAEIYRDELGVPLGPPPELWYTPQGALPSLIAGSGHFGPALHNGYAWRQSYTAKSFIDFLRTRTDHRRLSEPVRQKLLAAISQAIAAEGDRVELGFETHLHLAHRKD
jgi:SAM-dependent methyltransferase